VTLTQLIKEPSVLQNSRIHYVFKEIQATIIHSAPKHSFFIMFIALSYFHIYMQRTYSWFFTFGFGKKILSTFLGLLTTLHELTLL